MQVILQTVQFTQQLSTVTESKHLHISRHLYEMQDIHIHKKGNYLCSRWVFFLNTKKYIKIFFFIAFYLDLFEHCPEGGETGEQLLVSCQGKSHVADYVQVLH